MDGCLVDLLCLAAIVGISALPYLFGLGFYSDDWGLLAEFSQRMHGGASAFDLPKFFAARPVQGYYFLLLHHGFGFDPLGYHLVNTSVIAAAILLFYLLMIRLGAGRVEAFAIAVVFAILPQLSTVRVWIAASQIPLSMLLALCSMHALLSFSRTMGRSWLLGAVVAAALSIAAYEIFAPMIGAFGLWLAIDHYRLAAGGTAARRKSLLLAGSVVGLLGAALLFKLLLGEREGLTADPQRYLQGLYQLVRADYDWRVDSSLNIFAGLSVHFWHVIKGWADALLWAASGDAGPAAVAAAAAVTALSLWRLLVRAAPDTEKTLAPVQLLLIGAGAFVAGHAVFLLVPWIVFSPTGTGNRVLVAAAIGVAILFVSVTALAARQLPGAAARLCFAVLVALIAGAGTLRIAQIGGYWAQASDLQRQVLGAAKADLAKVPAGSTIILDGICPYHGPAPVFETRWDAANALSLTLNRDLRGDVVTNRMRTATDGLVTSMYGHPSLYRYGADLYVYDVAGRRLVQLPDAAAATAYFERSSPTKSNCPRYYLGHGVLLSDTGTS